MIGFPALSISSFAQDRMSRMDSRALNVLSSSTQRSWSVAQCSLELDPLPQMAHFMSRIVAEAICRAPLLCFAPPTEVP